MIRWHRTGLTATSYDQAQHRQAKSPRGIIASSPKSATERDAHMNQPVEDRFKQIEERLAKVEQQQTEPIKVTVERRQTEVERTLDLHTEMLRELSVQSDRHTQAFVRVSQILDAHTSSISDLQADVTSIKATLSDHGELLRQILAKLP